MAASTSQRLESFLTDALGAEALKALRAAISREPRLAKAMPQRALLSWAIAAIRHDFQGQVPGQEDMHISLRKTESGFQGLLQTPAGRQTLDGDLLTVVAGLALALELEADDDNHGWTDIGRQAAARLGKSLDQLAQTRLIRKEIELQKGFPRDEQENRDNHNSHLVLQDALLEGGKTVAEPHQQVDIPPGVDKRGKPVKDTKARQGRIDLAAYNNRAETGWDFDIPKNNTTDTAFWSTIGEQTSDAALRDVPPYIIDLGQGRTVPVHFSGGYRSGTVNLTVPTTPLVDGLHPSGRQWTPGDLSAMNFPLGELGKLHREKGDFNPSVGPEDLPEISQDVFVGAGVRAMGNHLHAHRDAIHAHLQQHLPKPTLLGKAERAAGWLPAFRHERTGRVLSCPEGYHDLNVLPEGNDQGYSTGFVDPEGNFFSREETRAKLGLNGTNSGALHAKQLEKMHATPTFPKLGMPDNRRETDIVTTPRQVEIKRRSQAASIRHIVKPENQAHYDLPEGTSAADAEAAAKGLMDDHLRGALGSVASGPFPGAHAHGDSRQRQLYNTLNPDVQDFNSALVDPSGKSTRSTQMHEDLHGMLGRVSEKYGTYARQNLSANLFKWAAYRAPAAAHAVFQSLRRWYDFKPGQQPHEELLASTLNMVNSPANRRDLQMRLGLDDDQMRQLQDKFKVFHQHMLEGGKLADLRWLDDGSFSGWLQGRPEEEVRSTNTGVRSDQLTPLPFLLNKTPAEQLREDLLNRPKPKHFLDDQRPNLNKALSEENPGKQPPHETNQVLSDQLQETQGFTAGLQGEQPAGRLPSWMVTLAGPEEMDGQAPYSYILEAPDFQTAHQAALVHHRQATGVMDYPFRLVQRYAGRFQSHFRPSSKGKGPVLTHHSVNGVSLGEDHGANDLRENVGSDPLPINKALPSREESERNYAHEQVLQDHLRETFPVETHVQPNVDKRYNRLDEIPDLKERATRGTSVDPETGAIKDRGPIKDSGARRTRSYTAELGNMPLQVTGKQGWDQYGGRDVNDNFDAVDSKILNENVRPPELGDLTFEWRSPTGAAESIGSWTEPVILPSSPTETPSGVMWPADENADPETERQRRKPRYIVAWNRGPQTSRWGEGPIAGVYLVNVNGRVSQHYGPEQPAVLQHLQNHVDSIGPDRWYGDLSTPEALRRPSFLKSDLSKGWPKDEQENQANFAAHQVLSDALQERGAQPVPTDEEGRVQMTHPHTSVGKRMTPTQLGALPHKRTVINAKRANTQANENLPRYAGQDAKFDSDFADEVNQHAFPIPDLRDDINQETYTFHHDWVPEGTTSNHFPSAGDGYEMVGPVNAVQVRDSRGIKLAHLLVDRGGKILLPWVHPQGPFAADPQAGDVLVQHLQNWLRATPNFLKSERESLAKGWPRSEAENRENQQADIRNPVAQDQLLSGLPPGSTVSETKFGPGSAGTEADVKRFYAGADGNQRGNITDAAQWNENQDNYYRQLQMPHSFGAMFDSEVNAEAFPLESMDHPVLGRIDFEWDRRSHFARAAGSTNNADIGWGIIGTTPSGINTLHAITPDGRVVSHPESLQGLRRVGSDAPVPEPEADGWDAEVAAHLQQQLDQKVPARQWQPLKPGDMDLGKSLRKSDDPLAAHHVLWDKLMERGWHLFGLQAGSPGPHTLKLLNPRVFNASGQNILGRPAEPGEVVEMMTHGPGARNWTGSPAFYNYGVGGQVGTTPHHQFDAQTYLQQLDSPPPPPPSGGKPVEKKDLMPGGKADGRPDSDFPPAALQQGTATEQEEHGLDRQRASEVAKDHLVEDPQYYRDEHLEKGWPANEAENQANQQGFLNQPVAQDQYLEGTGAQPQTHGERPTDANWPPRNERGFWAGHWDAYEANRAQNSSIRDSTGRQSRGFYESLDQPSFDSEILSDIHPLPRYPRVEFGVRRVEGPARFGDLFGSLTRFGDTPASGVVLTAWNSGAGEDLAHWRLGGDEGPVLLAGSPSQHLHEHVLNHYRDANRFFKAEELAKKGLEIEEDDLSDLGYARPDDFQVAAELQDQRNKSNWMQSKNFNVSRQVAGGAPKPAPKPRPAPKVDVPRRQAGKLNPEYQQKYQQQDDAKAKAAARARAYRQRQAQAQGREIKAKPEKPMTAQERYAKWAASDKGKAALKEKKASNWAALTDEQKAGKALALRLWRAGQKAKAGTLQKGWPRSEAENRDNQAGFVRESPPTEDRLMEQLPVKTQHGTAANYKIDAPRLPVAARTSSRSIDVDPDWFSADNRRRTWEAYDSNTASQERELREGGNPPVFRGFDHGSIHSSDRGADVEDDNLNVPQNAMLRAAGQMHLVERPEKDFWQLLSARADAAAKRKNIANGRSALKVTQLPKEIAEKMDKVELPGQTHQPTKQLEPLAPEAPEMQPAIAGLQTKKRGGGQ